MKTHDRGLRLTSIMLALAVLLSVSLPAAALAADRDTITIRTGADPAALSQSCTLDTWSRGKTVVLAAGMDLGATDFAPIPTFGGTFEGGGHTISGLALESGASYQGLFRCPQEGAEVRELHVTGTITAAGAQAYLGGIAGYACEVYQCVSLVRADASEGYAGSVAGEWDRKNGVIAANRFVEGPLAGVDGISYAGQAEPVVRTRAFIRDVICR